MKSEISANDEESLRKQRVREIYVKSIKTLGAEEFTEFEGFIKDDSNMRANNLAGKIRFNEKFVGLSDEEIQRWSWHEIQHTLTNLEHIDLSLEGDDRRLPYLFVLHPQLKDLHTRMSSVYEKYKSQGFPFLRPLLPIPEKFSEVRTSEEDYFSPLELISLLKGYQCYLEQTKNGEVLKTDPSEFIEAFEPKDLRLLDPLFRIELGKWVDTNKPEAAKMMKKVIKRDIQNNEKNIGDPTERLFRTQ